MSPEYEYLYTVYEEGSFSRAAERLFITQPALSIAVRKVEDQIGMPVFDRKKKPLELTDAGRIVIDALEKIRVIELEEKQKLADIRDLETGIVRIGGTHYLNAYILPDSLAAFNRRYPKVELIIYERSSFDIVQLLAERKIDLTFSCNPDNLKQFDGIPYFTDHVLFAVPKDSPFNREHSASALSAAEVIEGRHLNPQSVKLTIRDLENEELIILRKGNNLYDRVYDMFHEEGLEPKVKLALNQLVTAYHLAAAGMGPTFISDRIVRDSEIPLLFHPIDNRLAKRDFQILTSPDSYMPVAVRKLSEMLKSMAPGSR